MTLPYVEQGSASGVPLLLLHGYADSWRFFDLRPHLPEFVHAFAFTQRGHGDADRPTDGYRQEDFAGDVAAFMDAVGLPSAIIAGQSSGGYIAQRFAADHPERTLGLVLIGTPRDFRDKPASLMRTLADLTDPIDPQFVRDFVRSTITRPVPPAYLEMVIAECCKVPARVWQATLEGLINADIPTESAPITAPTLILWGDQDEFCSRREQEVLAQSIAGAELVTYPGTGHAVACEQPVRTADDLAAFARRIQGSF